MKKKLLVLHCAESGTKALAKIANSGNKLKTEIKTFELPCTGRVNEVLLMETLSGGYDGTLVVGCHRKNCRYLDGNRKAEKKMLRIKQLLTDAGITGKDVGIIFTAPDESDRLYREINDFYARLSNGVQREQSE